MFFSSDVANPDTYTHFYCDLQMYTTTMTQPDPEVFMRQFVSWEVATKANKWQGRNITRWQNEEYDELLQGGARPSSTRSSAPRMFIKMNDLVVNERGGHPGGRPAPASQRMANKLHAPLSGWDNNIWDLQDWYREA